MDGFETPYEDTVDVSFINCEICNKSIRGETLYKLHVTSQGHLKVSQIKSATNSCTYQSEVPWKSILKKKLNEETLIAQGKIPRQQFLPVFEDILQYLGYLNLDEPIIGLDYLVEVPGDVGENPSIKYNCTLCKVYSYINEAVQHVIGRKHRQKYLEKNRPDLVNWDTQRPQTMSGKIIRAKAEIAERQDGQGEPQPMSDRTKRLFPTLSIQGEPNKRQGSGFTKDMGPTMPKFGSYSNELGRQFMADYVQERYEDTLTKRGALGDREKFTEHYKQDRDSLGYSSGVGDYERQGSGDFSDVLGLQDQDRRPYGRSQREELYTDPIRKPPAQKDVLKEFYTEELRREQLAKAQKWPKEVDSHQHEHMRRPREIGPGASQIGYSTSLDGKNLYEIGNLIEDYRADAIMGLPHETLTNLGPSKVSPSRSGDLSRKMSSIPDPFMRFLKGEPSHNSKVRKRKSRFSNATAEEIHTAHEMFVDEYGPPDPKFPSLKAQQSNLPIGLKQTESYQTEPLPECAESTGDVFEMLKNIEIENEEEANFLKERLCSVLREFKARKANKVVQTGPSKIIKDYNNMRPVTQQHTQNSFGRIPRDNLDIRRAKDPYNESYEKMLDEDFQEHKYPALAETRYSNRNPYKEIKRWPNNNQPTHAPGNDMSDPGYGMSDPGYGMSNPGYGRPAPGYDRPAPGYDMPAPFPETFQEPLRSQDHQSAENFSDYPSSTSPLTMERGPRMNRPLQYSRNLDKITSTLLELVKRK